MWVVVPDPHKTECLQTGEESIYGHYFTLLREPFARAISLYRHEYRNSDALYHREARERSIAEFFRNPSSMQFYNSMTRMLSGQLNQEGGWYLEFDAPIETLFTLAQENLQTAFEYVGLTETFAQNNKQLEKLFSRRISLGRENVDANPLRQSLISVEAREAINEAFAFDQKLYNWVECEMQNGE